MRVDELDHQINLAINALANSAQPPTIEQLKLLLENNIRRTLLNEELRRVRDGKFGTLYASLFAPSAFVCYLERNRLVEGVNEHQ